MFAKVSGIVVPNAPTDDGKAPSEWCVPARSALPKGQPFKSRPKAATQELSLVAPVTQGQRIIDSGNAFDIVSLSDLTAEQEKRTQGSDGSLVMQTAGGETSAVGGLDLSDPSGKPAEAYVLANFRPLISWGRLRGEEGFFVSQGAG